MRGSAVLRLCSWFCTLSSGASYVRGLRPFSGITPPTYRHGPAALPLRPIARRPGHELGRAVSVVPRSTRWQVRCMTGGGGEDVLREAGTKFGVMKYRVLGAEATRLHPKSGKVLFLHGLGSSSSTCNPPETVLSHSSFLIPDFFGHGSSSLPLDPEAYSMTSLASSVYNILEQEEISDIFIIAHSMGGPVGIELCELALASSDVRIRGMIYEEGNLDEGDCFGSKKLASKEAPEVGPASSKPILRQFGAHACATDLVKVSCSNNLLPRLLQVKSAGIPVWFAYGEKNRGRFTSEKLLEQNQLPITFIPEGGHSMHADEGAQSFWTFVAEKLKEVE